jgi:hypothetical protein
VVGRAARLEEKMNVNKILVSKLLECVQLEDKADDIRRTLRWILGNKDVRMRGRWN